jgi:hypothetical protein
MDAQRRTAPIQEPLTSLRKGDRMTATTDFAGRGALVRWQIVHTRSALPDRATAINAQVLPGVKVVATVKRTIT